MLFKYFSITDFSVTHGDLTIGPANVAVLNGTTGVQLNCITNSTSPNIRGYLSVKWEFWDVNSSNYTLLTGFTVDYSPTPISFQFRVKDAYIDTYSVQWRNFISGARRQDVVESPPPPPYDSMSNVFTASLITRFNACAAQWIYRAFGAFCLIRAWTQWSTEGFWRLGRRWELAPLPSACQTGKRKGALPRYWGVWGGAPATNAFGSIWMWMEPFSE